MLQEVVSPRISALFYSKFSVLMPEVNRLGDALEQLLAARTDPVSRRSWASDTETWPETVSRRLVHFPLAGDLEQI